jgi:hypothetical protein
MRSLAGGLGAVDLGRSTHSGWSVATTFAHLAFWDDWVAERWQRWLAVGHFQDLPDDITDLVNEAALRGWRAIRPELSASVALQAAESLTNLIEHLPSNAVADAVATGRSAMVDRSVHWDPHLDEIENSLDSV